MICAFEQGQEVMPPRIPAIILTFVVFTGTNLARGSTATPITHAQYEDALRRALSLSTERNYAQASDILENALSQVADAGKKEWESVILSFLGSIYQRAGRYEDAAEALNKSIREITEVRGPKAFALIGPLANLGGLYYEARQFGHAEQYLLKAIEVQSSDSAVDPKLTGMLLTNLGSVYFGENKNAEAQDAAEKALEKFALVKEHSVDSEQGTARNYALLGALRLNAHDLPAAQSYLTKAQILWDAAAGPNDPRRAEAISNLGIYYEAAGDLPKAESLFQQAESVFQNSGGNNAYLQHFYNEYYEVELRLNHKKEAKRLQKQFRQLVNVGAVSTISRDVVDVSAFRASN